jgi:branched-chain amino acid transport system permease protein
VSTTDATGGTFSPGSRLLAQRVLIWLGWIARGIAVAAILFALGWVLFYARETNFGPMIDDPRSFFVTFLNGITFAGLLFIVASGFSLIFGLMRVVNMAHGSFYLVGGYVAYEIQQWVADAGGFSLVSSAVNPWEWILPALVACAFIGAGGLVLQQLLLRWNQGQDLRQALITIALSVIIADQVIAHFEDGLAVSVTWPGAIDRLVDLQVFDIQYSLVRLTMLGIGIAVGIALWLWLYRTRTGMVIRAGVDDQQMVSALGVNIQKTFAIAFVVGSALAALGGTVGASQGAAASGQDGLWLLNSLVVVIIGGMGSLLGAVAGSLLYGLVFSFSAVYLPTTSDNCCTQYSIVFTFVLLALVLAFRPQGLFGRPG